MKKILFLPLALSMFACGSQQHDNDATNADSVAVEMPATPPMAYFGAEITADNAVEAMQVVTNMGEADSMPMKVHGTIDKVCQAKGCWMTMRISDDQTMMVRFKDYGFFVPKDIDGKNVVVDGYAFQETISVEDLRHYAEDEGKTPEEIAAITEPETSLSFIANGVIIEDYVVEVGAESEAPAEEETHEHHHGHGH